LIAGFWGHEVDVAIAYVVLQCVVVVGEGVVGWWVIRVRFPLSPQKRMRLMRGPNEQTMRWETFTLVGADRKKLRSNDRRLLLRFLMQLSGFWVVGYQVRPSLSPSVL
jgi:hypothetical protein